jgi:hypothetical protein
VIRSFSARMLGVAAEIALIWASKMCKDQSFLAKLSDAELMQ